MTLLVVAEVAVPKTEPPLPMVKKTSWVSVGALGNCFSCAVCERPSSQSVKCQQPNPEYRKEIQKH